MARIVREVVGFLAFGAIIYVGFLAKGSADNRHYAKRVFAPVTEFDSVLASHRWHPDELSLSVKSFLGYDARDSCALAMVGLSERASREPPGRFLPVRRDRDFYMFGADTWQPTPVDTSIDIAAGWDECRLMMGDALFDRATRAMAEPGGWWRQVPETIFLYAPEAGVAFRMWQGRAT